MRLQPPNVGVALAAQEAAYAPTAGALAWTTTVIVVDGGVIGDELGAAQEASPVLGIPHVLPVGRSQPMAGPETIGAFPLGVVPRPFTHVVGVAPTAVGLPFAFGTKGELLDRQIPIAVRAMPGQGFLASSVFVVKPGAGPVGRERRRGGGI